MRVDPHDALRYFVWQGTQLFRTTANAEQQGRWDPDIEKWVAAGFFPFDKGFMNPDVDLVEVDEASVGKIFPGALGPERD